MNSIILRSSVVISMVVSGACAVATAGGPDPFASMPSTNEATGARAKISTDYSPVPVAVAHDSEVDSKVDRPEATSTPLALPVTSVEGVPTTATTAACGVASYPLDPVCPYCGQANCPNTPGNRCYVAKWGHDKSNCCCGPPGYVKSPIWPAGSHMHAIMARQIFAGQAALQVLNDYDFIPDAEQLSVRGRRELWKIVRRALHNHHPIIIEATPYRPELARARLEYVAKALETLPVPIDPSRLVVSQAPGRPPEGVESLLLFSGFARMSQGASQAQGSGGSLGNFPGSGGSGGGLGGAGGAGGGGMGGGGYGGNR